MKSQTIVSTDGIAVGGYDVVSYFSGQPQKGIAAYSKSWQDLTWHFSTADNLELFEKSPEKYSPQFGGHCALAMSLGELSPGSPESWHIQDQKLYFHNGGFTRFFFNLIPGRGAAAKAKWEKLAK